MKQQFLVKDFFEEGNPYLADYFIEHRELNMHTHEFFELCYVYESSGIHHYEDGSTEVIKEGEFIFVSPGISHCITSPPLEKGNWVRVCNLLLTKEFMSDIIEQLSPLEKGKDSKLYKLLLHKKAFCIHLKDHTNSINHLLMAALNEYKYFPSDCNELVSNVTLSLMLCISRLYEYKRNNEPIHTIKNESIDDIIRYVNSNYSNNITLDYMAAYAHLSPAYFSRYFKKCMGMNLSEYIMKTRIDKARAALRTTNYTINEICYSCGYKSIGNFQKAFKKEVGITAGEYRKMNR